MICNYIYLIAVLFLKKEIEPHCGEALCRLFDLIGPANNPHLDDATKSKMFEQIADNLSSIIGKSKQRHQELVNEISEKAKRKSSSRDREKEINGDNEDAKSNKSKNESDSEVSTTSSHEKRDNISSPSTESKKISSSPQNRSKDYNQYSHSSFRFITIELFNKIK